MSGSKECLAGKIAIKVTRAMNAMMFITFIMSGSKDGVSGEPAHDVYFHVWQ
jgi:hypothetical protein